MRVETLIRHRTQEKEIRLSGKLVMTGWTIVKEIDRKKRKERTVLKKSFLWGGITMIEKRNYVQID